MSMEREKGEEEIKDWKGKLAQFLNKRTILSTSSLLLAVGLFVCLNILVNLLFTSVRLDLTEARLFTLSKGTRSILSELSEPIRLRLYVSRKQLSDYPLLSNYAARVRDMLQEYEDRSGGNLKVAYIDPEPFSEEEDQAVAEGVRSIPVNTAGTQAYFGLVGTNSTGDRQLLPFLSPSKASSLEYDITKMIYRLANPKRPVVGLLGTLPLFGAEPGGKPWALINLISESFEIRDLSDRPTAITRGIDVLLLHHPKDFPDEVLYAIDQFVLRGGRLLALLDPLSDYDLTRPLEDQGVLPDVDSDLKLLFDAWGIEMLSDKVAGDKNAAMRVQHGGNRRVQEVDYLPWLRLTEDLLSDEDFSTSDLKALHLPSAGVLEKKEDSKVKFSPLMTTTVDTSTLLQRDLVVFQRDPDTIMQAFEPAGRALTVAARLSGEVETAFPGGPPGVESDDSEGNEAPNDPDFVEKGELNAIVVADSDLIQDRFWTRTRRIFNIEIPQTIADNGDFILNALENLSGSTHLISLRSRGEYARPFTRVEEIRREAESRYRDEEERLKKKLEETEARIRQLQQEEEGATSGRQILSREQALEIEKFKKERIKTRKQLRAVQHDLQKNIDALGSRLRFINIVFVPLLVVALGVLLHLLRMKKIRLRLDREQR